MKKPGVIVAVLFFTTFLIHFIFWKTVFHLPEIIIVKFYLFLSIMLMLMVTLMMIINKVATRYLRISLILVIFLKFMLMYLIKKKLHFEEIPNYKFHFILPYFVLIGLMTYYTVELLNYDKKQ